ncbi:MAG: YihY/virulence factor BrkB family protein [Bacillota bacterium]
MLQFSYLNKIKAHIEKPRYSRLRSFLTHYGMGLYDRIDEHHVFLNGGGLAFSLFVCIVPFVLIIFSILGSILEFNSVKNQIMVFIETIIPYEEYADFAEEIIFSRIKEVVEYKAIAGYIGGIGLFIAASGLFSSMRTILNKTFTYQKKEDKHPVIGKLRDFSMVLIVIILILVATFVLPAVDILREYTYKIPWLRFLKLSSIDHFFISSVSFLIIYVTLFIFYSFVPYAKLGRKVTALSALWAAVLWEVAKRLFGYYIAHVATLNKIYGTYALIVVIGFWIYYSCVTFILGAEIGQLYRERRIKRKQELSTTV